MRTVEPEWRSKIMVNTPRRLRVPVAGPHARLTNGRAARTGRWRGVTRHIETGRTGTVIPRAGWTRGPLREVMQQPRQVPCRWRGERSMPGRRPPTFREVLPGAHGVMLASRLPTVCPLNPILPAQRSCP